MRLLVTGAAGLLGSAACVEGRSRGHEVISLSHAQLDVTDAGAVRQAIGEGEPDAVIHCAAYTAVDRAESEPDVAMAVNSYGARNVASAAAEVGAVPVYVSTDYVFDGAKRTPYLPADLTGPLSVYGRTKLEGEEETARSTPQHVIVRTSWLYGDSRGFVPAILRRATAGEVLRIVDDQQGRPTWAPAAAGAIFDLVERGARGIWHVAGGGACTWLELAREALSLSGIAADVEPVTSEEFGATAPRPRYSVLDLTATEEWLGREMPHWREDLPRFLENWDG